MKSVVVCFAAAFAAIAGSAEVTTDILTFEEGKAPKCEPGDEISTTKVWINGKGEVEVDPESFFKSGDDLVYLPTNGFPSRVEVWEDRKIVVSERDYYCLTQEFAKVWRMMNEDDTYRQRIHGRRDRQIMTDTHKLTVYEDGFVYAEPLVRKRVPREPKSRTNAVRRVERKIDGSKRYQEFVKRLRERNARKFKEINVEHDAVTGKDSVRGMFDDSVMLNDIKPNRDEVLKIMDNTK